MDTATRTLDCDLCIVGAGYAALNALNAAAKYLRKGDRVVMVDKNDTWGGQWIQQYDFVRLHQPYRLFTAGDQPWTIDRDRSYLATRREVLTHLASVPVVSAGHLEITPLFRHEYLSHRVHGGRAEIELAPLANGSGNVRVRAKRLLKATGLNIQMLPAFPLSSTRVRSVGVADPVLTTREFLESEAPVYIIGSGKSAMDAVQYVARNSARPRRSIHILTGSGMWFLCRDQLCPPGTLRYAAGTLAADFFLLMCQWFDGSNEVEVMRRLERKRLILSVFGAAANFRLGILSGAERGEVLAAVDRTYRGHLVDVEGTRMTVRDGTHTHSVPIAEGSWFINCTTHFRALRHEPVLQDSGVVCAPQFGLGFTGATAYYLTHLWYRDALSAVAPHLYRVSVDMEPKLRFGTLFGLAVMANMSMVTKQLPASIMFNFEGDNNRWYPLHRRMAMLGRVLASQRAIRAKADQLLTMRFSDSSG